MPGVSRSSGYEGFAFLPLAAGSRTLLQATESKTVIRTLGALACLQLELQAEKEVGSVTWSSEGLGIVLQLGLGGKAVLASDIPKHYRGRLTVPYHGYSLQINSLGLQDARPYRAWKTLCIPLMNISESMVRKVERATLGHLLYLCSAWPIPSFLIARNLSVLRLEEAQHHCQLPDPEGRDLHAYPGQLSGTGRRRCSVPVGPPWLGGSCLPWGNCSQCFMHIW